MVKRKNTDQVQIKLRLVEALRKRLEDVAKEERRSLNSQLIIALEQWLDFREQSEHHRQWDKVRSQTEGAPSRTRSGPDQPDEQLAANLRTTAEGYRRAARRYDKRGAHKEAAELRDSADRADRDAKALNARTAEPPDLLEDEPELPRKLGGRT